MRLKEDEARVLFARMNKMGLRVQDQSAKHATIGNVEPAPAKKGKKKGGYSEIEHMFARQLGALELPPPQREFQFMPNRGFRLDYAWPDKKIAVEVNGMVHRIKERFLRDTEKVAYALIYGWIVLPVSGDDVRSGRGVSWLVTLWEQNKNEHRPGNRSDR